MANELASIKRLLRVSPEDPNIVQEQDWDGLLAAAQAALDDRATASGLAALLALKANLASPALTGVPSAPTAALGTNTNQIATMAAVKAAVDALVSSAPGVLDTLDELAAALGDDANFAATMVTALALKAPLASPGLTGTPTAPTAAPGTGTTQLATTAFAGIEAANAAAGAALPIGATIEFEGIDDPPNALEQNAATYSSTTYAPLFGKLVKSATVTMSIASPGVVTWVNHGLKIGFPFKATTTGALPTGMTAGTTYWIIAAGFTTGSFRVAATPGGTAINFTGSQSGTHTGICAPHGCANDLSTFNVPEKRGIFVRGWDNGRGTDADRGLGLEQAHALQTHTHNGVTGSNGGILGDTTGGTGAFYYQSAAAATTAPITGNVASETRPVNNTTRYFIKYQ